MRALLDRHGIEPSRALGQNFIVDPNTIDRLVALAGVGEGDRVVEIGPGLGALTLGLLDVGAEVLAVEMDRYLVPVLAEVTSGRAVTIVHADATELGWAADLTGEWKLVANLPYNVSTSLVLDVLEHVPEVTELSVLVQREVAERLAATPGGKDYGIPSVMRAVWADARLTGRVPASVFHPVPRVESAVVRLRRRTPRTADVAGVRRLVQQAFGQRRKMLRRSLAGMVGDDAYERAEVAPTARPEELGIEAWCALAAAAGGSDDDRSPG